MEIAWLGSGFWEDGYIIKKQKAWLQNKKPKLNVKTMRVGCGMCVKSVNSENCT